MPFATVSDPRQPHRRVRVAWAEVDSARGRQRWLQVDGHLWQESVDAEVPGFEGVPRDEADAAGDDPKDATSGAPELVAPMAARVIELLVRPGEQVDQGQALVVVEAMKCEQRLCAPVAATITEVLCRREQQVQDGQVLVRWDAAELATPP